MISVISSNVILPADVPVYRSLLPLLVRCMSGQTPLVVGQEALRTLEL